MIGIELQNISFSYSNQSIFRNLSEKFVPGEKIQVVGENGAGKTTLLKLACTILKPQEGKIKFYDPKFDHTRNSFRKCMGVVLDQNQLLRNFTVGENLKLYQLLYTEAKSFDKIANWLDRFHLQAYRETPIQFLSQGEQKKVSLIKAFLHQPNVIVLDEPTNSLDQESKKTLSDILISLPSDRLVLVSTHDTAWAQTWSNRSILVQDGKIS